MVDIQKSPIELAVEDSNEELEIVHAERIDGQIFLTLSDGTLKTVPDDGTVGVNFPKLEKLFDKILSPFDGLFKAIFSIVALLFTAGFALLLEVGKFAILFEIYDWIKSLF